MKILIIGGSHSLVGPLLARALVNAMGGAEAMVRQEKELEEIKAMNIQDLVKPEWDFKPSNEPFYMGLRKYRRRTKWNR